MQNHLMDFRRHLMYKIWRGPKDRNESNDEWPITTKEPTNMFPQLDEGIDVYALVNDGLPLTKPSIGLEDYLYMPDIIGIPTSTTRATIERIPLDINMTIVEKV